MSTRRMRVRLAMAACGLIMGACGGTDAHPEAQGYVLTVEHTYPGERPCTPQYEDEVRTSRGTCVAADNLTDEQYLSETGYAR